MGWLDDGWVDRCAHENLDGWMDGYMDETLDEYVNE